MMLVDLRIVWTQTWRALLALFNGVHVFAGQLFPHKGRNNFCYVSVDTHKRQCRCLYHAFTPFW